MNAKANTARALKDQPPLVSSIWCYFGLHNYTKWGQPTKEGIYYVQNRGCVNCGKFQRRKVTLPL